MTSCGQAITQPAQPVQSPEVMTSSWSSFHWKDHFLRGSAVGVDPSLGLHRGPFRAVPPGSGEVQAWASRTAIQAMTSAAKRPMS